MIDITPIIQAVITLIAVIITVVVIPYIRKKYTQTQLEEIDKWVKIAVGAAEQLLKGIDPDGTKRKAYVVDFLGSKGLTADMDAINTMIEAAVLEINLAQ